MTISIIIPTYNESARIEKLITFLIRNSDATITQIIISDGGSTDNTLTLAEKAGAIAVLSPGKGRANQMNYGAAHATGDLLYFVHADVYPPASFIADITNAVNNCFDLGRYRMRFDTKKWWLQINAFFTRFDFFVCYGGDQTLFITRKLFEETGGFKKNMLIMEDFEFTNRARQTGKYKIINKGALISDRKYDANSWLKVQLTHSKIVSMYKKGATQEQMIETYKKMLNYRKNSF